MKKALYVLLAIVLIGGITYGVTQSNLLKGNFGEITGLKNPDGTSGGDGSRDTTMDGIEGSWDPTGKFDPGGGFTPPTGGGGGTTSCNPEYYLDIYVETQDGINLSSISESSFDFPSGFDFSNEGSGQYRFDYTGSGTPSDNYEITVDPSGYQEGTVTATTNSTCTDYRYGHIIELDYNHSITVYDHNGDLVTDADVSTGTSYGTDCDYWDDEEVYLCATPDSGSSIYQVSVTGYVTERGSFSSTSFKPSMVFPWVGKASLLAATTGTAEFEATAYESASYEAASTATASTSYSTASGTAGDHKDVTVDEFAWTVTVTDGDTGNAITDADVSFTTSTDTDCDHQEDGLYWCSNTSYYSTSSYPSYSVSKTGYDTVTSSFTSTRSASTADGVNEDVTLYTTDTTDPASYCESVSASSDDLPLAADYSGKEISINVKVTASSSDFESTLYAKPTTGDGTLSDGTYSVTGSGGSYIYQDISGKSSTASYTYSDAADGDVLFFTAADGCETTLSITQEEDEEPEYELACTDIDIKPDSYEISLDSSSSTLHEFELEWDVIEQLVALRTAPEWIKRSFAYKHALNPSIFLATSSTDFETLTFTVGSTGNGDLYYENDLSTAYEELSYEISIEENDTVTFYYASADGGDSLYVTSSDSNCSDTLTLTEEEEEEEAVADTSTTDDSDDDIDFSTIEDTDSCDEYPFTDVDDDDDMSIYIYCLAQTGAVQGYGDGSYGPGNYITNAELVKIVVAMTGEPLASSSDSTDFVDIDGHWAERYIKTAEALDIARPREGVYFYPDAPATRGYLAVLLARGAEKTLWGWDENDIPFNDLSENDYYTYAVIMGSDDEGEIPGIGDEAIFEGYSDGSFRGEYPIRRDEAAAMLIRAFYAWYL